MRFVKMIPASILVAALFLPAGCALAQSQPANPEMESAAITKTCADFSDNFTRHDAQGVSMTFAEDSDFTNMRGSHAHGRKDIENWFAGIFKGNLRESVRTDTVRSIRFFSPELAAVDLDTVITGTKSADGSVGPARKGLMIVLMTKQNGHWFIDTFHESEYPAARPASGDSAK